MSAVPKAADMMIVLSMTPMMMSAVMPGRREMGRIPNLNITGLRRAIPITTSIVAMKMPDRMNINVGSGTPNSFSIIHLKAARAAGNRTNM